MVFDATFWRSLMRLDAMDLFERLADYKSSLSSKSLKEDKYEEFELRVKNLGAEVIKRIENNKSLSISIFSYN